MKKIALAVATLFVASGLVFAGETVTETKKDEVKQAPVAAPATTATTAKAPAADIQGTKEEKKVEKKEVKDVKNPEKKAE